MPDSDFLLDSATFALDRRAEIRVEINGTLLGGGIGEDGNITGIGVEYDLEQMPPTCALDVVTIPDWVLRGQDVLIYAGFDGQQTIMFKGKVKKRRHADSGHTIDCVGRTGKLTRPYRTLAKSFLSTGARDAILDILNDSGVDFTEALGEQVDIDAAVNNFVLGTVQAAILELGPPSDMIRKIADVDGNRVFETRAGTLRIRPLLEAPATNPFRTYTTATGSDRSTDTTLTYSDANIDAAFLLGNVAANTRRGQGFQVAAAGNVSTVSMWVRRVGSPTDNLRLRLHNDNGAGLPGAIELGGGAPTFNGQLLDTVNYTKVTMGIPASTQLATGTTYHVTIERDGALDAINYYEVGTDDTAPGYANGVASVRDATTWTASGGGDGADHPFEVVVRGFGRARILGISDDEDEDQVKKSVVVKGASLVSTDAEGNQVQSQIQGDAITLSDDLIVGGYILDANSNIIGTYYEASYQNDLIQTVIKADEVALRLLDKYHRVLDSIELEVPFDPRIDLGQTIGLIDTAPPGVTNKTGNWWIRGYRHSLAAGTASTQLSLFGGDQSGTTGVIPPRADFSIRLERELVGNAIMVVITFDASASTGKIVNYRWQDDYAGGAMDVNGPDLVRITRSYNPTVDSEVTVTLTVRDDNNLASSVSHTITMTTSNEGVYAPVVSCAAGNTCMATFDGGQSWSDIATPSGEARHTAITYNPNTPDAPMVVLFGTTTGRIYRSTNGMASLVLEYTDADGDSITGFGVDIVRRGIVWATTTDRVLLSLDYGDTWTVYTDFNNAANWFRHGPGHVNPGPTDPRPVRIKGMLVSDPSVNRIWIFGGRGNVVESWFGTNYLPDGGGANWWSEVTQGAGAAAQPRGANETVIDAVVSHATSGDLGLMFTDTVGAPANPYIYTDDFVPIQDAGWQVGGGSMVGVNTDGVGVAANNNQLQIFGAVLNNKNFYVSADGRSFWPLANVLPGTAGNRPHHLLQVSAWKDIYLAAMDEGIAKSIDFGRTWAFFRPQGAPINTTWPAGAIGWMVAIEYRRPRAFQVLASVVDQTAGQTATMLRNGTGAWVRQSLDATAYPYCRIFSFPGYGNTLFRVRSTNSTYEGNWQTLQRSTNLGVTWTDTSVVNCADITRAANGDLYAIGTGGDTQTHRIYRSTNQGVSWTEVRNDTTIAGGAYTRYRRIEADPTNPNRVVAAGWEEGTIGNTGQILLVTLDATAGVGATWSRIVPTTLQDEAEKSEMSLAIAQSGRILLAYEDFSGNTVFVDYSDGDGAALSWLPSLSFASSGNEPPRVMRPAGLHVYMLHAAVSGIHRTVDEGLNWSSFTDIGSIANARGLTYDGENDILYVGRAAQVNPTDLEQVQMMTPPTPGGVWVDVSAGITTASGFANHTRLCGDGLETFRG